MHLHGNIASSEIIAGPSCCVYLWDGAKCKGGIQIECHSPETREELCEFYGVDISQLPDEISLLDRIGNVVVVNNNRLNMGHWHADDWREERSACEEEKCGTTHCLAGWAQALCDSRDIRRLEPEIAGAILIPSMKQYFHSKPEFVIDFLRERRYATPAASSGL
jgi:hypothetical protein